MTDGIVLGLVLWFIAEIVGTIYPWDIGDTKPWVESFQTHWLRWPIKGILSIFAGTLWMNWYHTVALPNIQQGPIGWIMLILTTFVGVVLGVSAAKHTMTDYSMFG